MLRISVNFIAIILLTQNMENKIILQTERLILCEISDVHANGMLELHGDPKVFEYLDDPIIKSAEEAQNTIKYIQNQYHKNGFGRWAMIRKEDNRFIGWCGIKIETHQENGHCNFNDIGYRLIPSFWGKGYATEAAKACVSYAFEVLKLDELHGSVLTGNKSSENVLLKSGLNWIESFQEPTLSGNWFTLTRKEYEEKKEKLNSPNKQ